MIDLFDYRILLTFPINNSNRKHHNYQKCLKCLCSCQLNRNMQMLPLLFIVVITCIILLLLLFIVVVVNVVVSTHVGYSVY